MALHIHSREEMRVSEVITGKSLGLTAVSGRVLTVSEIATFLRVSESWVYKRMDDGTFPVSWLPFAERQRGIDSEKLNEWLRKIEIEAGTEPLQLKAERKIKQKEVVA